MTICTTVSRISLIWSILIICSFALAKVGSTRKQPQRKIDIKSDEFVTQDMLDQARIIRKINNDIIDLWGAVQYELEVLKSVTNLKQAADEAIGRLRERIFALKIEAEELSIYNHNWMNKKSEKIIKSIEQKIKRTQNPTSCRNASKLAVRIEGCGFGCLSSDLTQKFDIALKYDKVFIATPDKNGDVMYLYDGENILDFAFDPISACSKENITRKYVEYGCRQNTCESLGLRSKSFNMSNHKLVEIYMNLMKRDFAYTGYSASKEQWADISSFHGNPRAWWNGHLRRLLFRPQDWLAKKINYIERKINFILTIVGIHIRRSDKLRSKDEYTEFHVFEKYMKHVEDWYDRFDLKNVRNGRMQCVRRRVYLVTDDPDVWFQINRYKRYEFLGNLGATYAASIDDTRNTLYSLEDILVDTAMLSKCNYFVGTLSSRVATMVYELMQTNRLDGAEDAFSLDHSYGDPYEKNLFQQAVYSHGDPSDSGEFHMNPGDLIALTTKKFNGTYFGENQATLVYGYYPSYKVKPHPNIFVTAEQDNTEQFVAEEEDEE